jgi:transposase-like protein
MDTRDDGLIVGRRRRTHSAEFKAKVVSACRRPGVSMAAVALAHGLNANLVRRWVVTAELHPEQPTASTPVSVAASVEQRTFIPIELDHSRTTTPPPITIELRHRTTVVKVDWPLAAAAECAAWLRELLR